MKTTLAAIAATLTLFATVRAAPAGWLTDFEQAQAQAKETGRPILVNFSGSDWCGWCIRLDNEVLQKTEFKSYATNNLVLFEADFPRQTKLPEMIAKQNQALAERFSVQSFPTVLLLDAEGKLIARTGYIEGGPAVYVAHLQEFLAKRETPAARSPKPYEYDAENDRYWHPGHGHWHRGRPPEGE